MRPRTAWKTKPGWRPGCRVGINPETLASGEGFGMDVSKRNLSETEICDRFITPAIQSAGWDLERIRREYSFTDGRIIVRGRLVTRGRRLRETLIKAHSSPQGGLILIHETAARDDSASLPH